LLEQKRKEIAQMVIEAQANATEIEKQ